ncbi:MAG: ComEA family DNA-binding protein [Proteobacteria bacterium]|jgi:competence protein ComEA|nr:ComEA family DNA-binding protein [Pseudomonadota bacterium]MBK7116326.1 ComEA family DNA-binding protein [Pseudomonadota bacterium]MBK9253159.1 ComEA family DNA-binding protein [Pseudomonadota bacterium]MCC6631942.1 ComEA family DNA-binding protein [Gammaproteobacteria bacterium]
MLHRSIPALVLAATSLFSLAAFSGPVNVNTADAATLSRELKGIGMKRAEAIVEYRRRFGPFKSAEELALVKGIGPAAIQKNRDLIRIVDVKQATKPAAQAARPTPAKP